MGCQGRISYGGALESIVLHEEIESGKINMPQPKPLMGRDTKTPYVILADEAFVLTTRVMKPFSGVHKIGLKKKRVLNYRMSRARRTVENVVGILSVTF